MNCEEFNRWLDDPVSRRGGPIPVSAAEHLSGCAECRDLLNWLYEGAAGYDIPRPGSEMFSNLTPTRPLVEPSVFLLVSAGFLTLMVFLGAAILGTPAATTHPARSILLAAGFLGSVVLLSGSLRREMAPGSSSRYSATISGAAAISLLASLSVLGFRWDPSPDFVRLGLGCWVPGMILSLPAAGGLAWLARRGVFLSPHLAGSTMGLLAGASAFLTIQLRCVVFEMSHLLVWHTGIALAAASLGFLGGKILASLHQRA